MKAVKEVVLCLLNVFINEDYSSSLLNLLCNMQDSCQPVGTGWLGVLDWGFLVVVGNAGGLGFFSGFLVCGFWVFFPHQ